MFFAEKKKLKKKPQIGVANTAPPFPSHVRELIQLLLFF